MLYRKVWYTEMSTIYNAHYWAVSQSKNMRIIKCFVMIYFKADPTMLTSKAENNIEKNWQYCQGYHAQDSWKTCEHYVKILKIRKALLVYD